MKTIFKYRNINSVLFSSIRNIKWKTTRRKRQCIECGCKINKGDSYLNLESRYDYRIITVSFCNNCGIHNKIMLEGEKYILFQNTLTSVCNTCGQEINKCICRQHLI